jgi:hypothetical protein
MKGASPDPIGTTSARDRLTVECPLSLACHPETIRRGWLKDLNFHMTGQHMSMRARQAFAHFLLRGSSPGLTNVVPVGPTAVHSTIASCSLVPAKWMTPAGSV